MREGGDGKSARGARPHRMQTGCGARGLPCSERLEAGRVPGLEQEDTLPVLAGVRLLPERFLSRSAVRRGPFGLDSDREGAAEGDGEKGAGNSLVGLGRPAQSMPP